MNNTSFYPSKVPERNLKSENIILLTIWLILVFGGLVLALYHWFCESDRRIQPTEEEEDEDNEVV